MLNFSLYQKYSHPKYLLRSLLLLLSITLLFALWQVTAPFVGATNGFDPTNGQTVFEQAVTEQAISAAKMNADLEVVAALSLSPATPITGEAVTGSFAIRNNGSQPVSLARLLIGGRGDGCVDWDCTDYQNLPSIENVTIAPGETFNYSQSKTFLIPGDYFAQIFYQLANGSWGALGDRLDFPVSAQLLFDAPLTLSSTTPAAGETLDATFMLRNTSTQTAKLLRVGIGVRGPGCAEWDDCAVSNDMPFDADITLAPGEEYIYNYSKVYWETGSYFAKIAIKTADGWAFIDPEKSFTVTSGLAVTTPLSIVPNAVQTNEFVTASFTLQNQSSRALTYAKIGVGGRGPNCPPLDWRCTIGEDISFEESVTINPGETWQYSSPHFFPEAGDYFFQIWIQEIGGEWQTQGQIISMTVEPTLYPARSAELQVGAHFHTTLDIDKDTILLNHARDMGIDIVRIGVLWRFLEKDFKGDWDENWYIPALRQTIDKANELGIEVYINMYGAPCWASSDPNKNCLITTDDAYDYTYPARNHQDFASAFQKLVQEFDDHVDTWEIWNEPNIEEFWHPSQSMADYTNMLKIVYPAIKASDPNATVLAGVIAGTDASLVDEMYAAGAKGYFDALSIHPYADSPRDCTNRGWSFLCGVELIRSTMLKYDDPKPIWFSEFGWSSYAGEGGVGEITQRDYLADSIDILGKWDYVTAATWYALHDRDIKFPDRPEQEHFGLLDENFQDKPASLWLRSRPKPAAGLTLNRPLTLSSNAAAQDGTMTASFSLQNNSSQPITLRQSGVIVRDAACDPHLVCSSYQDFPLEQNITIAPGDTYVYNQENRSTQGGPHFAQIVYESSIGEWFVEGEQMALTIGSDSVVTAVPVITDVPIATAVPVATDVPTATPLPTSTAVPTLAQTPVPNTTPALTPTPARSSPALTSTPVPTASSGTSTSPPTASPNSTGDLFLPMLVR